MSDYRIETKCVQAGYTPGNGEPRQIPIIQSTTFKYATSEDMASSLTSKRPAISIPACKTRRATTLRRKSRRWRAAAQPC